MADEYIKRQALLDAYDAAHKGPPGGARKLIAEAPAEDVVPVVRCKDCRWRAYDCIERDYYCDHAVGMYGCVSADDYCSYGERKDGE